MNYHEKYYNSIKNNEVVVGRKILQTYEYFVEVLPNKIDTEWEYREDLVDHVVNFMERYLALSKGKAQKIKLLPFQKAALSLIFGWVRKGTTIRKHTIVHFTVARKNGKSTFASGIGLYMLFADGEHGPEVYSVATKQDQAKLIWSEATKMVRKSPELRRLGRTLYSEIISDINEGTFKALGRDSKSLDGLNPSAALMDEIHAWTDMNMFDVINDGMIARENPLILLTSTAGSVRNNVWDNFYNEGKDQINSYLKSEELNERVLYLFYELDSKDEWDKPQMWEKANPALGSLLKIEDLKSKVSDAKRYPEKISNLVMKHFNIPDTGSSAWLNLDEILNDTKMTWLPETKEFLITDYLVSGNMVDERTKVIKGLYGIGGFDLSETIDLTCASVMFKVKNDHRIFLKQMYWIPEDLIDERIADDKVPYKAWKNRGLLRTCVGNKINYKDVKEWFIEVQEVYDIYLTKIGYDGWSASYLVDELAGYFGSNSMEKVIQGAITLSSPMKQFGADLKSKNIVYDANPIFEWCTTNVEIAPDSNGNIKPTKKKNAGTRIDGFASALDAYVALERNIENYTNMIGG